MSFEDISLLNINPESQKTSQSEYNMVNMISAFLKSGRLAPTLIKLTSLKLSKLFIYMVYCSHTRYLGL